MRQSDSAPPNPDVPHLGNAPFRSRELVRGLEAPRKFRSGPLKVVAHNRKQFKEALQTYYEMAGYDRKTGAPTDSKLHELDLGWVVEDAQQRAEAAGG